MSRKQTIEATRKESQERFLKALDARMLNVSAACAAANISRTIAYKWRENDTDFAERWKDVEEGFFDKLETMMFSKAITEQDSTMLIWLSKTKMKHRGYVEKTEVDAKVNTFEQFMRDLPDNPEDLDV